MRVLVVAPHPDDETLGCGGTMARMSSAGLEVYALAIACHGVNTGDGATSASDREAEFHDACAQLGVKESGILWKPPVQETLTARTARLVSALESDSNLSLERIAPDVVFIPTANAFHQDHRAVHEAAFSACRLRGAGYLGPRCVLGYEGPEDHWRQEPSSNTIYVDTSSTWDTKKAALRVYEKQMRQAPHPRSVEAIEVLDRANGVACGLEFAERFTSYRLDLSLLLAM